jgi:hypothetical protein
VSGRAARFVVAVAGVFCLVGIGVASAYWIATDSSNPAAAAGDTLPAGLTPTAATTPAANSTTVGLTFSTAATTTGGRSITTYTVRRYATGSSTASSTFTCSTPVSSSTCQEASVPDGSWQYTVAATVSLWQGVEGPKSSSVIVDTTAPTVPTPTLVADAHVYGSGGTTFVNNGVTLNDAATDAGSAVASVSYYRCPAIGTCNTTSPLIGSSSSGPSYPVTWNGQPADGAYRIIAVAVDNKSNTAQSSTLTVTVDNTGGSATTPTAIAGANRFDNGGTTFVDNGVILNSSASDSGSGPASVSYYRCPATGTCDSTTWTAIGSSSSGPSYPVTWNGQPTDGAYRIAATATDNLGNSGGISGLLAVTVDNSAPAVSRPVVNGNS